MKCEKKEKKMRKNLFLSVKGDVVESSGLKIGQALEKRLDEQGEMRREKGTSCLSDLVQEIHSEKTHFLHF